VFEYEKTAKKIVKHVNALKEFISPSDLNELTAVLSIDE
jgi:hypothetical protein